MDNPSETLLTEIESFLDRTGTPPSVFGRNAISDPNFVWNLRAGREPRFSTVKRVMKFIESNRDNAS